MSKVGSGSSPTTRARGRRNYWVRTGISPSTAGDQAARSGSPGGKRFLQPYRLSDAQRAEMLAPLEAMGVGDEASRQLFAAALEYDLASCPGLAGAAAVGARRERQQTTAEKDAAIAEIAMAAQRLAQQLEHLEGAASARLQRAMEDADRFRRSYDARYLDSLRCELLRLASTGEQTHRPPREPPVSAEARRFVLRAADAFAACFELTPTTEPGSAFRTAIAAVVTATGIRVPTDDGSLARLFERD
jgi:hypothetical protein